MVGDAPATDAFGIPAHDFVEQAHAALMRNVPQDPRVVQAHG
jgi:hypothetical protein